MLDRPDYPAEGDDEAAFILRSLYPSARRGTKRALARMIETLEANPTSRKIKAQSKAEALRNLIAPDLSAYGAASAVGLAIREYRGNAWSIDRERKQAPIGGQDKLIHELILSLRPDGEHPYEITDRTLLNWFK
jgi:hypothetical protein